MDSRIGSLDAERRKNDFVTAHMIVETTRPQHIIDQDTRPRIDAISTPHERRDEMALIAGKAHQVFSDATRCAEHQ